MNGTISTMTLTPRTHGQREARRSWASDRKGLLFGLCFAVLLVGVLSGCQDSSANPERPANVPIGAFWVGGMEGGVFVELAKSQGDPPDLYRGAIYYERSGEIWFKGRFRLEPSGPARIDTNNHLLFDGWDGDALHLTDGRTLKAIRERK